MGHGAYATAASRSRGVLAATLVMTGGFTVVELLGGFVTGSLALVAIWVATRPPTPAKTYGYYRAEILAALVNALLLLVVAGTILYEAYQRFRTPREVWGLPMLVVAGAGLAVNVIGAWLLHDHAAASLNVRA